MSSGHIVTVLKSYAEPTKNSNDMNALMLQQLEKDDTLEDGNHFYEIQNNSSGGLKCFLNSRCLEELTQNKQPNTK